MPSKDTIPFKMTKQTHEELDRIRKIVSKELGISENNITWKQAEIILRLKALNGKITQKQISEVLLGKIKWIQKDK